MGNIIAAIAVLGILGALFGLILAVAHRGFGYIIFRQLVGAA